MAIQVANVTTDGTTVYTSSGNTVVTFLSLCNYSVANATIDIAVVNNGNVASESNLVITELDIVPSDTYQFYVGNEKLLLNNGDFIFVLSSANNAITSCVSYTSA